MAQEIKIFLNTSWSMTKQLQRPLKGLKCLSGVNGGGRWERDERWVAGSGWGKWGGFRWCQECEQWICSFKGAKIKISYVPLKTFHAWCIADLQKIFVGWDLTWYILKAYRHIVLKISESRILHSRLSYRNIITKLISKPTPQIIYFNQSLIVTS